MPPSPPTLTSGLESVQAVQVAHDSEAHHLAGVAKGQVARDLEAAVTGLRAVQTALNKWQREMSDKQQEVGLGSKVRSRGGAVSYMCV
jgi:hypothetical protein